MRWHRVIRCAICPRRFVAQRDAQQVCPACKERKLAEVKDYGKEYQTVPWHGQTSIGNTP